MFGHDLPQGHSNRVYTPTTTESDLYRSSIDIWSDVFRFVLLRTQSCRTNRAKSQAET